MIASIIFGNSYSHLKRWHLSCRVYVKDTILADLTIKVATDKISEEECRKLFENILNN